MAEETSISSGLKTFGEKMQLLCAMNNLGMTSIERSHTADGIARMVGMDPLTVKGLLEKLRAEGYVAELRVGEEVRYYTTPKGVLKVSATYT